MSKLKDAGPTVAIRIKMCGTKEELATTMANPFHAQQGGSFNLGTALKKVAKGAKAAAPCVSAASGAAILAGTVTGQPEVVALGAAGKAASKLAGGVKKKAADEASALRAFAGSYADITQITGEETTDENELNMAGLAMFPREWAGVFAADETPPKRGYCVQNTAPRASGGVHWRARANGLIYDSYGRRKYGDFSGDAEQKKDETCCGQMCLAWLCVHKELGARAARLI